MQAYKIEIVQRTFTKRLFYRLYSGIPYTNYENRLLFLNLTSLSQRRLRADLILAYTIINGLVEFIVQGYLKLTHQEVEVLPLKF